MHGRISLRHEVAQKRDRGRTKLRNTKCIEHVEKRGTQVEGKTSGKGEKRDERR